MSQSALYGHSKGLWKWAIKHRLGVVIGAMVMSAYVAFYQSEIQAVKLEALQEYVLTPTYVGALTLNRSGSGLMAHSTNFDGGYGIGVPNEWARDDMTRRYRPIAYLPFATEWEVSPVELARGMKPGYPYKIKIYQGRIFEVADNTHMILPYAEYAEKVASKKRALLIAAGMLLLLGSAVWAFAEYLTRRQVRET